MTSVTAVRATPKAIKLLEEAEENKGSELTTWEKAKTTTKAYLPSILFGVSTIACIAGSSILSYNTQKSMASAYALINQSYRDYRRKAKDIYGEDADRKILDAIIAEKAKTMYVEAPGICDCATLYIDENHGEKRLFYDEYVSGRYTYNDYGWTSLRNADIVSVRDGYWIKLPRPRPIK